MTFILSILARWKALGPSGRVLGYIGAAVALVALLGVLRGCYDRSVIREHEREVAEHVREKTDAGDKAGRDAADATKSDVEAGNERARDAAAGSDDPLKSGLDEIGRDGGRN